WFVERLVPLHGGASRPALVNGRNRFLLSELIAGHSHGQGFWCPNGGLSGVRLAVFAYGRRNTCGLVLHLRTSPASLTDIYTLELSAYNLGDESMLAFRFPPLADSANR